MRKKFIYIYILTLFSVGASAQTKDIFGNSIPAPKNTVQSKANAQHNKTDNDGQKQGYWEKYHSNGKLAYTVTFVDNKPVGLMTRYYESGKKQIEINYNTNQYGSATIYNDEEKIVATGFYNATKRDSLWQIFSAEGIKQSTEMYKDGQKNGLTTYYYKNGSIAEEIEWQNNKKHGVWKKYYEDGKPQAVSQFNNDNVDGNYTVYYPNGKIEIKGKYINGVEDGTWEIFNNDQTVAYKIEYSEGKVLNQDVFDKMQQDLFDSFEKNKTLLKDPEQYKHDPDGYMQ